MINHHVLHDCFTLLYQIYNLVNMERGTFSYHQKYNLIHTPTTVHATINRPWWIQSFLKFSILFYLFSISLLHFIFMNSSFDISWLVRLFYLFFFFWGSICVCCFVLNCIDNYFNISYTARLALHNYCGWNVICMFFFLWILSKISLFSRNELSFSSKQNTQTTL